MRCRVCRQRAVIELRRHNAAFCRDHFITHLRRQVERTIADFEMFGPEDRLLLGVSGGKDSLALWDILTDLGYRVDGVYLELGIDEYSAESRKLVEEFAHRRSLGLRVIDLAEEVGFSVPEAARSTRRSPCSVCGSSKRYLLNQAAAGYDVLVTGHNLDDESATLFSNVATWNTEYLGRQAPVLPAAAGFVKKVKPLVRVAERETAAYAVLRGIAYEVEECPMVAGNTLNRTKRWLNLLEEQSPGIKQQFLFGFLERAAVRFDDEEKPRLIACGECGQPTTGDICAFCRTRRRVRAGGEEWGR